MSAPATPDAPTRRVLSGVQTSGALHLGNYLGALTKFVRLQDEGECFFFLADLHAITVPQDPLKLAAQTREIAAAFLAAGVDPNRATIFPQSAVPQHAEMGWILNCTARLGWLDRMTQFKEKSGQHKERASVGLYTYPVLQAADILLYKATHVPVGEDQKQHLELTRDIAGKFNNDFGAPGGAPDFFPLPEPLIEGPGSEGPGSEGAGSKGLGARVMSLRDGSAKMSKSDPSDQSRINLTDGRDAIVQKLRKARTDAEPLPETPEGLERRPEADNLVGIYAALSGETKAQVLRRFAGQGFGTFKPALAEVVADRLAPIGAELNRLLAAPDEVDAVLRKGAERARSVAEPILAETKRLVGFWREDARSGR